MGQVLQPGRYACVQIRGRNLLFPGAEAQLLIMRDQIEQKNGVTCVPYQNHWVPVLALNEHFRLKTPGNAFALVLDNGINCLALACDQLSWVELVDPPDAFPSVLRWSGCPILATTAIRKDSEVLPVWVSSLSHLWNALNIQSEQSNEPECLAG